MTVTRVFDLLPHQLAKFSQNEAISMKLNGQWISYSTQQFQEYANKVSLGLLDLGIIKDDKVAIISFNRTEWNMVDFGIQQLGAISVPMYPNSTIEDYKYILTDADVKVVFVGTEDLYLKVKEAAKGLPCELTIYTFDKIQGTKHWKDILATTTQNESVLDNFKNQVQPDDVVTLIYTSGTTGTPKGVMLTHTNVVSNFTACLPLMPVTNGHKALSFLPLCHVYERMLNYLYIYTGVSIYYAENLETISDNLKEIKPHIFVTVPRLLEKVYDKIYAKGQLLTGVKRKLFFWALELGLKHEISKPNGFWYDIQLKIANKLIFNKWREALGGNIIAIVSGGAALQPRLARVFWAANLPVMEGFGLTETSPVICVNRCNRTENRIGTVGPTISGVEIKIAEDGEILAKGPNIMKGYYKKPEQTAEVIDSDGWFHTGDIGELVEGRFLKITDRKKEMFKTSGGKYISPQQMENKFKESIMIEQIMVVGENQKFPSALIVPAFTQLKEWCLFKGLNYTTDAEMIKTPEVIEKLNREVETANQVYAKYEQVKKFVLLAQLWTVDAGELTPKMSLKRKVISKKYQKEIENMYNSIS